MTNRLQYLDTLKGIAILCIVLLHYEDGIFPQELNLVIGLFMITAFYVSCGIIHLLKDEEVNLAKIAKKRFKQLMIPYFWFSVLIIGFDSLLCICHEKEVIHLAKEIYYTFTLRGIGTLWFLPVLFLSELSFILLKKHRWVKYIALILCVLGVAFCDNILQDIWTSQEIKTVCIRAFVLTVMRICQAILIINSTWWVECNWTRKIKENMNLRATIGITIFSVGVIFSITNFTTIFYLNSILCLIVSFLLPYGIALFLSCFTLPQIKYGLQYWGKNSLIVMATHYSFLMQLCIIADKYLLNEGGHETLYGWNSLAFFGLTLIVEIPIIEFINTHCSFLLGKSIVKQV